MEQRGQGVGRASGLTDRSRPRASRARMGFGRRAGLINIDMQRTYTTACEPDPKQIK